MVEHVELEARLCLQILGTLPAHELILRITHDHEARVRPPEDAVEVGRLDIGLERHLLAAGDRAVCGVRELAHPGIVPLLLAELRCTLPDPCKLRLIILYTGNDAISLRPPLLSETAESGLLRPLSFSIILCAFGRLRLLLELLQRTAQSGDRIFLGTKRLLCLRERCVRPGLQIIEAADFCPGFAFRQERKLRLLLFDFITGGLLCRLQLDLLRLRLSDFSAQRFELPLCLRDLLLEARLSLRPKRQLLHGGLQCACCGLHIGARRLHTLVALVQYRGSHHDASVRCLRVAVRRWPMCCALVFRFRRALAVRGRLRCPRVLHLHITEEHRTLLQHMLCRGLVVTLQSIGRPALFVHLPVKLLRHLLCLLHIGFGRCRLGKSREMALPGDGMPADRTAIARLQIACEDTGLLTEKRPVLFFIGSIGLLEAAHRRRQCLLRRLQCPVLSAERIIVFLQCTELVLLSCIGLLRRLLRRELCLHTAEGL